MKKSQLKKIQGIKVSNFYSSRGTKVANQFEVRIPGVGRVFQSYESIIAVRLEDGGIVLDKARWDYSNTTGRYRNQFLGEGIVETRKKIESGDYTLADLN